MAILDWDENEMYDSDWEDEDEDETEIWDNSYQAGGLPRSLSPFSDVNDPYERSGMEYALFNSLFNQWIQYLDRTEYADSTAEKYVFA